VVPGTHTRRLLGRGSATGSNRHRDDGPLEDRILVQTLDAEQTTASGLVIPDTAKEKPQEGKVLAVGPGRFDEDGDKRIPLDIKVGDVVIYSKYGGTEVKYNNEEYLILSARDVLAVVEK